MRLGRAMAMALIGLDAAPVEVEASIGGGLPRTVIVGLADTALSEARERCRAAVTSSGFDWPAQLVTVNLSPASLPKAGSHYDLSIVAAVLAAAGVVPGADPRATVLLGELALDGRVRPVRGVLPALLAARGAGCERAVVPLAQAREALLVEGLAVVGVRSLPDLVAVLRGGDPPSLPPADPDAGHGRPGGDLADVVGQEEAKWALEVAAAGGHHLFLHGPPGVGKTLLAERLPGILPDLAPSEALEVAAVRSLRGVPLTGTLDLRPPYSSPHHSASVPALVGGGSRVAMPGAISLAHRGVLFLDEAPEFGVRTLEALRTPLERGIVVLARSVGQATYPARFQLVLAANPCPCGLWGTPGSDCTCPPAAIRRYATRVSGPILDRIDLHQHLRPVPRLFLAGTRAAPESSASVAERVHQARARQHRRLASFGCSLNVEVPGRVLRRELPVPHGVELVDTALARGVLSARGVDKVLRLAWSLADLAGHERPGRDEVGAALALRRGEPTPGVRRG